MSCRVRASPSFAPPSSREAPPLEKVRARPCSLGSRRRHAGRLRPPLLGLRVRPRSSALGPPGSCLRVPRNVRCARRWLVAVSRSEAQSQGLRCQNQYENNRFLGAFRISLSPPSGIALMNSSLVSPRLGARAVNTGEKRDFRSQTLS